MEMGKKIIKILFFTFLASVNQISSALSQTCNDVIEFYADGTTTATSGSTLITGTAYRGSAFTYVMPAGFTSVRIQVWGAGAAGGRAYLSGSGAGKGAEAAAGGGGGGAYSAYNLDTFEGDILGIVVGSGGSAGNPPENGAESFVSREWDFHNGSASPASFEAIAFGGLAGENVNSDGAAGSGGSGGSTSGAVGDYTNAGGNGADGLLPEGGKKGAPGGGGGGGSSAGPGSLDTGEDGTDGIVVAGGTAPLGGGDGAKDKGGNGSNGESPGGGGGGAFADGEEDRDGGNGADGLVRLTLLCTTPPTVDLGDCSASIIDPGSPEGDFDRVIIQFTNGPCSWPIPSDIDALDILVVGGGGGGGSDSGGGGAGGGLTHLNIPDFSSTGINPGTSELSITTIGAGGAGSTDVNFRGGDGQATEISFASTSFTALAAGGGGGGSDDEAGDQSERDGTDGGVNSVTLDTGIALGAGKNISGSGGGGGHSSDDTWGLGGSGGIADTLPGSLPGHNGGDVDIIGGQWHSGAGGGGASEDGSDAQNSKDGGDGGDGIQITVEGNTIFGDIFYAGGGGGGGQDNGGAGGKNSGGDGGDDGIDGGNGLSPGSGGGGGGHGANGGNGAKGAVIVSYLSPRILPIEFLYFDADYDEMSRSAKLSWSTAREWESSHFEIERAENDIKSWSKVGEIEGAGNSDIPIKYNFKDSFLPNEGGIIFYKIKQVDLDGELTYSKTRAIQVQPIPRSFQWRVYPNPTTGDTFSIEMADPSKYNDEPITIRMISIRGQAKVLDIQDIRTMGDKVREWLEAQGNGVYILEITWGTLREQHKVILRR